MTVYGIDTGGNHDALPVRGYSLVGDTTAHLHDQYLYRFGGMDHDLRTLEYLKDGTLFVAQVQNCYDMGYKLVYNAVKTIDGEAVEEEATNVGSTSVYADSADKYIEMLYGESADAE